MHELKDSFLVEARDLLDRASQCLLTLEAAPSDGPAVAALFRAVHTLKGNSGLFPVEPLTRVVHAAEDLLDQVRGGLIHLDGAATDAVFEALDQAQQWLTVFETTDDLPDDAAEVAAGLAARLARFRAETVEPDEPPPATRGIAPDWLDDLPAAERERAEAVMASPGPLVAVDYRPDPDCFFKGDDPFLIMLTLPGRAWLSVTPVEPLVAGPTFDPFRCVLRLRALTGADPAEVETHFAYVASQVAIAPILDEGATAPATDPAVLRAALANQIEALATEAADVLLEGRIASAAAVLSSIASAAGQTGLAARLPAACDAALAARSTGPLHELALALRSALEPEAAEAPPHETAEVTRTSAPPQARRPGVLKVDQARIDMLMKLAGELIVAKNALPFLARRAEEVHGSREMGREIKAQYDVFNRIVDELQTTVMQVRMVPLGSVFERFRRLVRDLARQLGKAVRLEIEGEETEADKTIVEDLADPLVHLIRNAIDHGLETAEDRVEAGKPAEGLVKLSARLGDGQVIIEIADDGRGIDAGRVRAKAIERGLVTAEAAALLSDDEAFRFILQPGFSTAETISNLSGRGVGMDVVATMVERCGGSLALRSRPGHGTTVAITLPLTMAVRRVMMVELAGTLYGIPLESTIETLRLPRGQVHTHLGRQRIVLRDRLIPLCDLRTVLDLPPLDPAAEELSVLVVGSSGGEAGLVVDAFRSGVDIIPHPVDGPLSGLAWLSGTALLGDGSILLLLNVEEILKCPW